LFDSRVDHRILYRGGNGDESRDAISVFDSRRFRDKRNTPRDYERRSRQSNQSKSSNGVRAGIMRVDDVDARALDVLANRKRGSDVPVVTHHYWCDVEPRQSSSFQKRRLRWRKNDLRVTSSPQSLSQQKYLPLSSAPLSTGIDVKNF
jgi:hypothetical protein